MVNKKRLRQPKIIKPEIFIPTEDRHKRFSEELTDLIKKYKEVLNPIEVIALLSHAVGAILTLVPEEHIRNGAALELVQRNIDAGNEQMSNATAGLDALVGDPTMIQ